MRKCKKSFCLFFENEWKYGVGDDWSSLGFTLFFEHSNHVWCTGQIPRPMTPIFFESMARAKKQLRHFKYSDTLGTSPYCSLYCTQYLCYCVGCRAIGVGGGGSILIHLFHYAAIFTQYEKLCINYFSSNFAASNAHFQQFVENSTTVSRMPVYGGVCRNISSNLPIHNCIHVSFAHTLYIYSYLFIHVTRELYYTFVQRVLGKKNKLCTCIPLFISQFQLQTSKSEIHKFY